MQDVKRHFVMASGILLVVGCAAGTAGAQCAFQHPAKAKEVRLSFVQAFVPCEAPNSMTEMGVQSCESPQTFNELAGSPANGWLWGPNSSGSVSFKVARNKIVDPDFNPSPNTADIRVRINLNGIEDADGPVDGPATLVPLRRTTFEDRAGGDMTVVDFGVPVFVMSVVGGRARVRTSANVVLNQFGFKGVPGCTSLELLGLELRDENNTLFGVTGIFVPDLPNS